MEEGRAVATSNCSINLSWKERQNETWERGGGGREKKERGEERKEREICIDRGKEGREKEGKRERDRKTERRGREGCWEGEIGRESENVTLSHFLAYLEEKV